MSNMLSFPVKQPPANQQSTRFQMYHWRIVIRDLELICFLGVLDHEKTTPQLVRISVECDYVATVPDDQAGLDQVVPYDVMIEGIEQLCRAKHIRLVETLGQSIADFCLSDKRVQQVFIRVEKPTIYPNAKSVGIELVRDQKDMGNYTAP